MNTYPYIFSNDVFNWISNYSEGGGERVRSTPCLYSVIFKRGLLHSGFNLQSVYFYLIFSCSFIAGCLFNVYEEENEYKRNLRMQGSLEVLKLALSNHLAVITHDVLQ